MAHLKEASRLISLNRMQILDSNLKVEFDEIVKSISQICETAMASITLIGETRYWSEASAGIKVEEGAREDSFCNHVLERSETLVVSDSFLDPVLKHNIHVTGPNPVRFYAGAPLTTADGHILGTLCVFDLSPKTLTIIQVQSLEVLAKQVVRLMEFRLKNKENTFVLSPSQTQKTGALRILIAEDNVINQMVATNMVEGIGHKAHVVSNGLEALEALEMASYDLILMDCQMPELDGYKTTHQIRQKKDRPYKDIAIIAITANALAGDEQACLAAGMDAYVAKPVNQKVLERVIVSTVLKKSARTSA